MKKILPILASILLIAGVYLFEKEGPTSNGTVIEAINNGSFDESERYEIPRFSQATTYDQLLCRYSYTTSYNSSTRNPNWVGWVLTDDHLDGPFARKGHYFVEDKDVPEPRAVYSDIREGECGYQRGHLCPAADNKWAQEAQDDAFLMTNISPQNGDLNQRDWKYLEDQCRRWAAEYGKIYIVAGPIFYTTNYSTVGENRVAVPDAFFKVVLAYNGTQPQSIGFIYPNEEGHRPMTDYAHSIDYVEEATGLDFFYQLDDNIEVPLEANTDFTTWTFPKEKTRR